MGYSERTPQRRFATRVADLDDVIGALDIRGDVPLFLAAHDWGGAIAMGWAVDHVERLAGMILCNTGIAVPEGRSAPAIIRLAASAGMLELVCHGTPTFVEGTIRLSGDRLSAADRSALRAPYKGAQARVAIADFVGDIPLHPGHPSERAIAAVADRLHEIAVPVLLAWGSRDPVFNDDFAADLAARLPNAVLHRFPNANHLVMAEAVAGERSVPDVADHFMSEVIANPNPTLNPDLNTNRRLRQDFGRHGARNPDANGDVAVETDVAVERDPDGGDVFRGLGAGVRERAGDDAVAFVDMATGDELRWAELAQRIDAIAADLLRRGLERGDRVAMLTPPGIDLVAAVYGVWRAGGITVVADRGLGVRGLGAAIKGARPRWVIGPRRALLAGRTFRWAPRSTAVNVEELVGATAPVGTSSLPAEPAADDVVAILFTSGATGPAKGVVYRHRQLAAQRDALARTYQITADDRLVAAFAPFALYGPALGIPTCLPACDVTKPAELTAATLDDACVRIGATLAFGSPSALANVVATGAERATWPGLAGLRTVFSAGAPVPPETLHAVADLAPSASLHTPYGMTEALPVTDIDLPAIDAALLDDPTGGVCVGRPVDGARVQVDGSSEILVTAPWVSDGYLDLWDTQHRARMFDGEAVWHRSGDVGHLDDAGRLWVEGRTVHVIHSEAGPITPVPVERVVERGLGVARSAAVGVGPVGVQQLVVVLEDQASDPGLASTSSTDEVRRLIERPVAAVLTLPHLPVDIRHNAKIDRTAVAVWAAAVLAGRRARPPK